MDDGDVGAMDAVLRDAELIKLLRSWSICGETISTLEEHRISVEDLKTISDEDLKEIIPRVGLRNALKKKLQGWRDSLMLPSTSKNGSLQLTAEGAAVLEDIMNDMDNYYIPETPRSSKSQSVLPSGSSKSEESSDSLSEESSEGSSDEPDSRRAGAKSKRAPGRSPHNGSTDTDYDLDKVLTKYGVRGKIVLHKFNLDKKLNDTLRGYVAEIVVKHEMREGVHTRVTTARALQIARKIVERFPTEILATWYREVPRPGYAQYKSVKGRIMTRFYTVRRSLINAGLIESNVANLNEEEGDDSQNLDEDDPQNTAEALAWLKSRNITPWNRVIETWTATRNARMKELHQPEEVTVQEEVKGKRGKKKKVVKKVQKKSSELKVYSYTSQFPQILLEYDFEYLFKDAVLKLSLEIDKLIAFLKMKLLEEDPDFLFDVDLPDDAERAFTFFSLSKLFPVHTIAVKDSGTQWRPSRLEIKDSFLLHVPAYQDLNETLATRRKRLKDFEFSDQPLAVVVGSSTKKFEKSLVVFDTCECEGETPMKAVDVAFKTYHALHAWYPPESDQLWHFMQKAVYKFNTKWDKSYAKVDELVAVYAQFSV